MLKVLYISPTGMAEALGQSQVLEYVYDLAKTNDIILFSFEKKHDQVKLPDLKKKINAKQINWFSQDYSNQYGLFSTAWLLISAFFRLFIICKKHKPRVIHTRSLLAAFLGWPLAKIFHAKLVFDIRGFAIDEKVDNGRLRKDSFLYYFLRKIEGFLYIHCDHLVTLTHASKKIITKAYQITENKITVIPTCVNKNIFHPFSKEERIQLRCNKGFSSNQIILLHPGAINRYAFKQEVELFVNLYQLNPCFHFIILNEHEHASIQQILAHYKVNPDSYSLFAAPFKEMPFWLNIADAAIFFPKFSYATEAMAPTKFAEVVACHIPTITSKGTGDLGYYMANYKVGLCIDLLDFGKKINEHTQATLTLLSDNLHKSQYDALVSDYFDKILAVKRYNGIYNGLG